MRCIVVRGDAWPLFLSACNTLITNVRTPDMHSMLLPHSPLQVSTFSVNPVAMVNSYCTSCTGRHPQVVIHIAAPRLRLAREICKTKIDYHARSGRQQLPCA